jgi:cobalt/nickel transport system permease protein
VSRRNDKDCHAQKLHGHEHTHQGDLHRHPHHHTGQAFHDHGHTLAFERLSYICSPLHELDPRAKVVAGAAVILGIVLTPAMRPAEFVGILALLLAVAFLGNLPIRTVLGRSALVLPVAASIAAFSPLSLLGTPGVASVGAAYAQGWPLAWSIVSKAWLSATTVLLVSATTSPPRLFHAFRRLKMPLIFITMLTFLYRYAGVLAEQLSSMRRAVASRGSKMSGLRLVRLYGNLAGNLFLRAYERGERVHAAMLSRGYDGTLPTAEKLALRPADALVVVTATLVAFALALY